MAAPLDVVKIRLQLQTSGNKYSGIVGTMRTIYAEEGVRALWKGNVPAAIMYVIYGATQFTTYTMYNGLLSGLESRYGFDMSGSTHSFLLGSLAGCTSTLISYPFDLLRTRFVNNRDHKLVTMRHALRSMYRHEGLRALFKGANTAMISVSLYTGSLFWSYELARSFAHKVRFTDSIVEPACGLVGGVVSKTIVFPLDLIRKRLQVNTSPQSRNFISMGLQVVRHEGVRGLYKGFFVSLVKNAPTTAISIWTYEVVVRLLERKLV